MLKELLTRIFSVLYRVFLHIDKDDTHFAFVAFFSTIICCYILSTVNLLINAAHLDVEYWYLNDYINIYTAIGVAIFIYFQFYAHNKKKYKFYRFTNIDGIVTLLFVLGGIVMVAVAVIVYVFKVRIR